MLKIIFAAFSILHGLVHMLYFSQARRTMELSSGMTWPDGSWAFGWLLGEAGTRTAAAIACNLATFCFIAAAGALIFHYVWWRGALIIAASFSSLLYILFWNGRLENLGDQGFIGILINLILLAIVLGLKWPEVTT